jgi:hypothetical protein
MTDKDLFIEEKLLNSVKRLLSGRVNELVGEAEYSIPPIEFGQSGITGLPGGVRQGRNSTAGGYSVVPVVALTGCERNEKERIIRLDAYTLTISFAVPEYPAGERNCYAYASSAATALLENPTLGGAASRAVLTGKKYMPPKYPGTGEGWEIILTLRVTVQADGGMRKEKFC